MDRIPPQQELQLAAVAIENPPPLPPKMAASEQMQLGDLLNHTTSIISVPADAVEENSLPSLPPKPTKLVVIRIYYSSMHFMIPYIPGAVNLQYLKFQPGHLNVYKPYSLISKDCAKTDIPVYHRSYYVFIILNSLNSVLTLFMC